MPLYSGSYRNDLDDDTELKALEEQRAAEVAKQQEEQELEQPAATPEETTYKKRYSDLRRHSQLQENKLKADIAALQKQVDALSKGSLQLPKTEAEIEAWAEQYPDVAKIIESIAIRKAKEVEDSLNTRFSKVEELERQAVRDKAEAMLMKLVPDIDDYRESEEFHTWVQEQPQLIQDAIYHNESDARAVARVIDLYKADKGLGKKKPVEKKVDAAMDIPRGSRNTPAPDGNGKKVWKESEVSKLSSRQFDQYEEDIMAARREGRFVYDLSQRVGASM